MLSARLAFAALALAASAGEASAQAYQCKVPQGRISVPDIRPNGPVRKTRITGFTLALSWSPEFCRFRQNSRRDVRQCSGRAGRFGFILHGLWPEGPGGRYPQWCPAPRKPAPRVIRPNLCMTPSTRLLAHEWAKHGSCLTRKPATYFKISRILWNSLRFPDLDRLSRRRDLTAGDIRKAWVRANPGFKAGSVGIKMDNKGWFEEIRLCYRRNYRPGPCDRKRFGPADSRKIRVWRGL